MKDVIAIIKDRFDKVMNMIKMASFEGDVHPEESKIRLEQDIVDGKSQYIFNLKKEDVDGVVEFSLNRNDVFVPNRWGVFVSLVEVATGVEHLYPYIPVAPTGTASIHRFGFLTDALESLYSGFLSWNVGTTVALSNYPMEKFKKVPQVQGAFVLDGDNNVVNEGIQSEFNIDDMMTLIIPRYTICGTRDHTINVNFPAANKTFPVTSGYKAKLVLMMDGFLVKGGCEHKAGKNPFGQAVGQW